MGKRLQLKKDKPFGINEIKLLGQVAGRQRDLFLKRSPFTCGILLFTLLVDLQSNVMQLPIHLEVSIALPELSPVSYTHLDVYKRQT